MGERSADSARTEPVARSVAAVVGRAAGEIGALAPLDLAAVAVVLLFPLVSLIGTPFSPTSARLALMVVLLPAGVLAVVRAVRRGDPVSRWVVGVGAIALLSTALSHHPVTTLVGDISGRTSTLVLLGFLGCWGMGRVYSGRQGLLGDALIAGSTVQLVLVAGQLVVLHENQPFGFTGNSVFAAVLLAAAVVVMLDRAVGRSSWRWAVASVPYFYVACVLGSRAAIGGLVAAGIVLSWRKPRWLVAGGIAVALLAGIATNSGYDSVGSRLERHSPMDDLEWRATVWHVGWKAFAQRPMTGWGPGRFLEGTERRVPVGLVKDGSADTRFADAHNLVVEDLATLGSTATIAMLVIIGASLWRGSGEMRLVVVTTLVFHLLEPQSLAVTPVLFLALGASLPRLADPPGNAQRERRWVPAAVALATALLLVEASLIVVCDLSLTAARHRPTSLAAYRRAERVEPLWGTPAVFTSAAATALADAKPRPSPGATARYHAQAIAAAARAVRRDPDSAQFLYTQADLTLRWGDPKLALTQFEHANVVGPWYPEILTGLRLAAVEVGDSLEADIAQYELCLVQAPKAEC